MVGSELNELRKRKTKRILLWTCGITATAAIITIFAILGLAGVSSSGAGWSATIGFPLLEIYRDLTNPVNNILSIIKNINLI